MWTSLSVGRWTCLLALAGAMLVSASQGDTFVIPSCCHKLSSRTREPVEYDCFIQEPRKGCLVSAYMVKPKGHEWRCIKQDSRWMKMMMRKNKVKCSPEFSYPHHRSAVLARMMQRN